MQITPVLLIEWKLRAPPPPSAVQMLVLNLPLSQMLKYSKCMWENWHSSAKLILSRWCDGDVGGPATHHNHI